MNVIEFRDMLNKLIEEGKGEHIVISLDEDYGNALMFYSVEEGFVANTKETDFHGEEMNSYFSIDDLEIEDELIDPEYIQNVKDIYKRKGTYKAIRFSYC